MRDGRSPSARRQAFDVRKRGIHRSCRDTVYLRFPREHWNRIRHSNFIERTFGETRRRVKVIGCLPGEHSCLSLVWAVLDRASACWRGFTMAPAGLRLLQDLRR
jgi:putative transposase